MKQIKGCLFVLCLFSFGCGTEIESSRDNKVKSSEQLSKHIPTPNFPKAIIYYSTDRFKNKTEVIKNTSTLNNAPSNTKYKSSFQNDQGSRYEYEIVFIGYMPEGSADLQVDGKTSIPQKKVDIYLFQIKTPGEDWVNMTYFYYGGESIVFDRFGTKIIINDQ